MVQAIIFDFYGVLALNGWQAFKAAHFADREAVWDRLYQLGRQVDAGAKTYAELVRFTAEQSGESEATVRRQLEHTVINAELLEFIRIALYGHYHLGILSNSRNDQAVGRLLTSEQRALFDVVTLSHHVGIAKPDPRTYQFVAERLGVPPQECLFVDDREHHTAGAQAAGMQAMVYTDFTEFKRELLFLLTNT